MSINYLIYGLLAIGCLTILSNFLDAKWIIAKLFAKKIKPLAVSKDSTSKEADFLHIISLWYQLKEQCDRCKLKIASEKLDEVFPLLNGVLDDEQDI
jgi:hypothetical protein